MIDGQLSCPCCQ